MPILCECLFPRIDANQAIGMSRADYATFRSGIRKYDKQVDSIMRDSSIGRELKREAIGKVLAARRAYTKQHLTEEQMQTPVGHCKTTG